MKTAIRVMYILGLAALSVAALRALRSGGDVWFTKAVYLSVAFTATILLVLWGISELAIRFIARGWLRIILFLMSVGAVLAPSIYIVVGVFLGEAKAEYKTWHLLSMFAVMYQIFGVVIGVVIGSAVTAVTATARALVGWLRGERRNIQNNLGSTNSGSENSKQIRVTTNKSGSKNKQGHTPKTIRVTSQKLNIVKGKRSNKSGS